MVGPAAAAAGQVRVQLPALRGAGVHHDRHHVGRRRAAGAGNWTAYLNLGTPWLPAGWAMVSTPMAIIVGAVAAACGLSGLAMRTSGRSLPLGCPLAVRQRQAHWPVTAGPSAAGCIKTVDHLLDGALAPFSERVQAGTGHRGRAGAGAGAPAATWLARSPSGRASPIQRIFTVEARAVVGIVLIGLMLPYLSGRVLNPGSFFAVPRYWYQVAAFLAARSPLERRAGGARGCARRVPQG